MGLIKKVALAALIYTFYKATLSSDKEVKDLLKKKIAKYRPKLSELYDLIDMYTYSSTTVNDSLTQEDLQKKSESLKAIIDKVNVDQFVDISYENYVRIKTIIEKTFNIENASKSVSKKVETK